MIDWESIFHYAIVLAMAVCSGYMSVALVKFFVELFKHLKND